MNVTLVLMRPLFVSICLFVQHTSAYVRVVVYADIDTIFFLWTLICIVFIIAQRDNGGCELAKRNNIFYTF